ncbi:LamG-like jellyroll fold domain-containing protein [Halorussus pelagicus]|uniref:LamG-like jellyroll fold domain-containing protein n=1 Tax=Halorussus pelagicus TaxID=2505977 RepID=UPI0014072AAE|nr:LamG-like jellyroll fold domain-containing protein [Halorussus pelagicus]
MTDVREATDDLLAEKPDLESDLREVLAVDERADNWTFEEVPLDSGTFGELVSQGIVVKDGDEYEIADPQAVQASLDGESEKATKHDSGGGPTMPDLSLPSVSRVEAGALGTVLAFVLLMRTYIYPSVFRGEYVVLPSNDPYYYRYWVDQLAVNATGVFDFSVLSGLPTAVEKGEPLTVATLWWLTNLLGGADASGLVLAWYPVVSALVVSLLVYALAVRVTGDRRVGLASVAFLAVSPAFAYRTGLGFADHHAFDYPWLVLTALTLVVLADVDRESLQRPRTLLWSAILGVAVAGQVLAWEAGPLLVGALGVYVASRAIADVRADRSPLVTTAPVLAGLALASVLSHLAHAGFGWHTDVVAYSPVLLLVGVAAISLLGEAVRRVGMPAYVLGTAEVAGALSGLALIFSFLPSYASVLNYQIDFLLFRTGIAENRSMFAGGPSGILLGPILELGFAWVLALPMLGWASWRVYRRDHTEWVVVCVYGWYFLVLATLQRRFVGEFTPFVAILAGYAFVVLGAKLNIVTGPSFARSRANKQSQSADGGVESIGLPDRGTIVALAVLFLFVSSAGAVQTGVRNEQVKIDDDKVDAAVWMGSYAEDRGLEYPENYVLSKWGRNRMYNYFVNDEAKSYTFAERNYEKFLSSHDPEAEYNRLSDRVGFLVTKNLDLNGEALPESNYARLHKRFGSVGPNGERGAGHYRAVYASEDGSVKVFTLVPGVSITGEAKPNTTLTIEKKIDIEGASFMYERAISVNELGVYEVTVPYPGTYEIGGETVEVSEREVRAGTQMNLLGDSGAYWPFDDPTDDTAYDVRSGNHLTAGSAKWVESRHGNAIVLNKTQKLQTDDSPSLDANESVTMAMWFRTNQSVDYRNDVKYPRIALKGEVTPFRKTDGYQIAMARGQLIGVVGNGTNAAKVQGPRVDDGKWHHATLMWNGTEATLYVDGQAVDRADWTGTIGNDDSFVVGHGYPGTIDEMRVWKRGLSPEEIREFRSDESSGSETGQ